jgi:hypothetical protein
MAGKELGWRRERENQGRGSWREGRKTRERKKGGREEWDLGDR